MVGRKLWNNVFAWWRWGSVRLQRLATRDENEKLERWSTFFILCKDFSFGSGWNQSSRWGVRRKIFSKPHSSVIQPTIIHGVNEASKFEVLSDNGIPRFEGRVAGVQILFMHFKSIYFTRNWLFVESLFYSHNRFIIFSEAAFWNHPSTRLDIRDKRMRRELSGFISLLNTIVRDFKRDSCFQLSLWHNIRLLSQLILVTKSNSTRNTFNHFTTLSPSRRAFPTVSLKWKIKSGWKLAIYNSTFDLCNASRVELFLYCNLSSCRRRNREGLCSSL